MRPDVKLGVLISMVFVLVAGTYYLYRDRRESPIPLATAPEVSSQPAAVDQLADSAPARMPARTQPPVTSKTRHSDAADARGGQVAERGPSAPVRPVAEPAVRSTPEGMANRRSIGTKSPGAPPASVPERVANTRSIDTARPPAESGLDGPPGGGRPVRQSVPTDAEAVAQVDETAQEAGPPAVHRAPVRSQRPTPLVATRRTQPGTAERPAAPSGGTAIETHRVQSGDTLSLLAERYYGSPKHTRFLAEANPQISDPNVLRIGTVVKIVPLPADGTADRPRSTPSSADTATASGQRTYRVKAGDSFYSIARDVLGDPKRWQELLDMNRDAVGGDPTHLQTGQVLVLPKQ